MKFSHFFIRKQYVFGFQLVILSFLLSGCWSAKEIHNIAIINDMAIDLNDAGEFEVTAVIVKPSALFPQSANGMSNKSRYLIETTSGKTLFEAMGKLSKSIPEKMYLGHMNVAIFGERIAKERMNSALDFFTRENEFRPNIQLLVTKGNASNIVSTSPELNKTLGLEVLDLVKGSRYSSTKMVKDISKFKEDLTSDTTDPYTGVVTISEKQGIKAKREDQESTNYEKGNPQVISLDGTALFKGGKLKGYLNDKETSTFLLLKGKLKNEVFVIHYGNNKDDNVSVLIHENRSEMIPQIDGKTNKITINTYIEGEIRDVTSSAPPIDSRHIEQLNQQLENQIIEESTALLNKVQKEWQTDIFGFGRAMYQKYPYRWDQMAQDWRNGGLKDLHVDINVKANISRFGLRKDPSNANESR